MSNDNTSPRPRAVASGTIFGGVDCYVLGDGATVLSQSGMVRGLRGETDVSESANLTRYLARLPAKYSGLAACTNFEFVLPDGGVAIGRPARDFVAMCRAYAEMYADGSIHKARIPIARNCIAILAGLADVGIDELVYRASGYQRSAPAQADPKMTAVVERLLGIVAGLESRLEAVESRPANISRPSLGTGGARIHVLDPLKEIARIEARAIGKEDAKSLSRTRKLADDTLRGRLGFPRDGGQSWAMFPQARLGDLNCALLRMFHDARKRADIAMPTATQLSLVSNINSKRSAS